MYKSSLAVGGTAHEKSKMQLRRLTPDSDVLASSDDDREQVSAVIRPTVGGYPGGRRPSSGWLQDIQPNRKYSLPSVSFAGSQPTTPSLELPQQARPSTSAFPWNTSSFTSVQSNSRLKEVIPSPTSAHAPALPSPIIVEGDDGIDFLLNQQDPSPLRKAVRSQSYSIGQGDLEHSPVGQFSTRHRPASNLRHRPSRPSLLSESILGLSQLREDETDEVESSNGSEHGARLSASHWEREQHQALLKQAAMENARARNRATSTGSPITQPSNQQRRKTTQGSRIDPYGNMNEHAIEENEEVGSIIGHPTSSLTRRFSEHVSNLRYEVGVEMNNIPQQLWATGNISALGTDALGRRHSFAHYSSYSSAMPLSTLSNTQEEDEESQSRHDEESLKDNELFDAAAYFTGHGPASRAIHASAISTAYPNPILPNIAISTANPYSAPHMLGRPGRQLFVVTFKCSRADIYYLYDNIGLEIRRGDLVIVEGDRGCDLGQVTHADVSFEDAKKYKSEANEEHFRWLVMFSQYSLAGASSNLGMLGALARANGFPNPMSRCQLTGMGAQQESDTKPKMIKRLAQQHEILALREKEGGEAKAKRLGAQKAADHKLPMEILDAEYQADYHKLTYFYYAESYVNFNDLVTDLFKQYKVRIWMSAVNPASVVNPAGNTQIPPPSAIGPGAILKFNNISASVSVGGFNHNDYRYHEQQNRNRRNDDYPNYDDGYNAFSHQLPAFQSSQASYTMPHWAHGQPVYNRYGGYPMPTSGYSNTTAGGNSMDRYGGYYPPASYPAPSSYHAPSSDPAYRGCSSAVSPCGSLQPPTGSANLSNSQYATVDFRYEASGIGLPASTSHHNYISPTCAHTTSTGVSSGYSEYATTGAIQNSSHDAAILTAMPSLSLGSK